ncbi:MAG: acyl-CoA dehydrogenase, partial [Actinobacteria bacterium]|nr:acyl-CoA dehydrogenase [Actinomycetota bacterium]
MADSAKDLTTAANVIEGVGALLVRATKRLAESGGPEKHQVLAYDLAHSSAALETARSLLDYGAKGGVEATIACAFVADMVHDFATRLIGREETWGVRVSELSEFDAFVNIYRAPEVLASLAATAGPRHLDG